MFIVIERIIYLLASLFLKLILQIITIAVFFGLALAIGLNYSALMQVVYLLFTISTPHYQNLNSSPTLP